MKFNSKKSGTFLFVAATLVSAVELVQAKDTKNLSQDTGNLPTAGSQNMTEADTQIIAKIRRDIVDNKELSTAGKNVQIISENGYVVLRGEVRAIWEKEWIGMRAKQVANVRNTQNLLKVNTDSK